MSSLMEILRNMRKELEYLESVVHHETNDPENHHESPVAEYQLRIKHSAPSIKYRVCCKCRQNKSFRQFSKID